MLVWAPGLAIGSGIVEERRHFGCTKTELHEIIREDENTVQPGKKVSKEERCTRVGSKGGDTDPGLVYVYRYGWMDKQTGGRGGSLRMEEGGLTVRLRSLNSSFSSQKV